MMDLLWVDLENCSVYSVQSSPLLFHALYNIASQPINHFIIYIMISAWAQPPPIKHQMDAY